MSDPSKHRLLRAVRLLPGAVRVGRGGIEEIDPAGENAQAPSVPAIPEMVDKTELLKAEAEIRKLKSELRQREEELTADRRRTSDLQIELDALHASIEQDRTDLREEAARAAAEQKERALKEGYEEGHGKGYAEGQLKAETEKQAEYEGKFATALALLDEVGASLSSARNDLALGNAPFLIRLWEALLARMLQTKVTLDPAVVGRVLEAILKRVSDRERILVYLNSADIAMIEGSKEELVNAIRGVKVFEILSDDYVDRGSCLIETNLGIYDARWKTQLEQIASEVQALLTESMLSDGQSDD